MTEKDYITIAKIIKEADASDYHDGCMGRGKISFTEEIVEHFADYFKKIDKNFNSKSFLKNCGF